MRDRTGEDHPLMYEQSFYRLVYAVRRSRVFGLYTYHVYRNNGVDIKAHSDAQIVVDCNDSAFDARKTSLKPPH